MRRVAAISGRPLYLGQFAGLDAGPGRYFHRMGVITREEKDAIKAGTDEPVVVIEQALNGTHVSSVPFPAEMSFMCRPSMSGFRAAISRATGISLRPDHYFRRSKLRGFL